MNRRILLAIACLLAFGCRSGNQVSGLKVLIGATAVMYPGGAPAEDSVVVISGSTIRAAGLRKDVPIPQDSERTDLTGKWIFPAANGRIAPGEPADILVLDAGPNGTAPAAGTSVSRRLIHGQWN
jgi:imidazolonepropionase-like amidohydrolase